MNNDRSQNEDAQLHALLQTWQIEPGLSPRFHERVWRRIGREEEKGSRLRWPWTHALAAWLGGLLRHPVGAVAYLAAIVVAGIGLGFWQAENHVAQTETVWRSTYLQAVDPYADTKPE